MSGQSSTDDYLNGLPGLLPRLDRNAIATAIGWMCEPRNANRTIYVCGNGGSASTYSTAAVSNNFSSNLTFVFSCV
jgi:hypothetical protein